MDRKTRIERALKASFSPTRLEVVDESGQHAGHAGARPEGQTHYRIRIVSEQLNAMPRVAAHQQIYAALASELNSGLHALAIELLRS